MAVSVCLAAVAVGDGMLKGPTCPIPPYRLWWNVGGTNFTNKDVSMYGFEPGSATQTGNGCSTPNCSSWTQGLWPMITDSGVSVNGGVPQNASLDPHVANLKATVVKWIPDPQWTGNGVFDFEAWTPIWEQNSGTGNWHGNRYQHASIALVRAEHPTWNESAVTAAAKEAFETAALRWFVATLQAVTAIRPRAAWGFYGIPQGYSEPCAAPGSQTEPKCGYRFPGMSALWTAENDRMQPLFDASTALFPSVYLPPARSPPYTARNLDYIRGTTEEAVRLARHGQPVRPFAWAMYHDQSSFLLPTDMRLDLAGGGDVGADGVVLWGAPVAFKDGPAYDEYLGSTLGPIASSVKASACACSVANCSGHGRCVDSGCHCYPGFSGSSCAQ